MYRSPQARRTSAHGHEQGPGGQLPVLLVVLPGLREAEFSVRTSPYDIGILVALAVVLPKADRADFKPASFNDCPALAAGESAGRVFESPRGRSCFFPRLICDASPSPQTLPLTDPPFTVKLRPISKEPEGRGNNGFIYWGDSSEGMTNQTKGGENYDRESSPAYY
jgi:hypothetical protein